MDQENQEQQSTSVSPNPGALKTSEKGTKKSGKVLPIILILVALAGVGFGVYGMFFRPEPTAPTCPTCVAENPEKPEEENAEPILPSIASPNDNFLDISRIKNRHHDDGTTYAFNENYYAFNEYINIYEKKYLLYYTNNPEENGPGWFIDNLDDDGEDIKINVSNNVVQALYGLFGQDAGHEKIIFVLNDGTVEYVPIMDNPSFESKKIDSLQNIIRVHQSNYRAPGGGYTVVVEDIDGNYYDLELLLRETNS